MLQKLSTLLLRENEGGLVYFVVLVCVLVSIWLFLIVTAIEIQRESAEKYILPSSQTTEQTSSS